MDTTIKHAGLGKFVAVEAEPVWTDAIRQARYSWLSELPGLVFGLITMAYIVTSPGALL
jgi:hypothetical protein